MHEICDVKSPSQNYFLFSIDINSNTFGIEKANIVSITTKYNSVYTDDFLSLYILQFVVTNFRSNCDLVLHWTQNGLFNIRNL